MRILLVLLLLCSILKGFSQTEKIPHYVVLYSGEKYEGKRLLYDSPILKASRFDLDGAHYETPTVAFFQNNHGYFANLSKIYNEKSERFAIRIKSGKVNLFEEIEIAAYASDELQIPEEGDQKANEMLASGESFQYFNKGDGPIMKADYKHMKAELVDNAESLKEVKLFRNYRYLQIALIGAGAGLIAYDIFKQSGDAVRLSPIMVVGAVISGSSFFLENSKENARWRAVDAYNKN